MGAEVIALESTDKLTQPAKKNDERDTDNLSYGHGGMLMFERSAVDA